jgi:hypothetical protein
MRRIVLMAIVAGGVFYAPLPLIAQNGGGGNAPLMPVADIPNNSGGATAPSEAPLETDPDKAPQLVPPEQVNSGGGTSAPAAPATPAPPTPAPAPAPAPAAPATPEPAATPALSPEAERRGRSSDDAVVLAPAEPAQDETDTVPEEPTDTTEEEPPPEEFEEEFDDDVPSPGVPESPAVAPQASAGPRLPMTGPEIPAIVLSGLSLMAAGMALRALVRERS